MDGVIRHGVSWRLVVRKELYANAAVWLHAAAFFPLLLCGVARHVYQVTTSDMTSDQGPLPAAFRNLALK